MNVDDELREAERTGKVAIGFNETIREVKNKNAKLAVISANCPDFVKSNVLRAAKLANISTIFYEGSSADLGIALGKPFLVSISAVVEPGESNILKAGRIESEG